MTGEDEVRLFGQPVKITVPGTADKKYQIPVWKTPVISADQVYPGYALCDLKDTLTYGWTEIYVEVDSKLYCMADFLGSDKHAYAVGDYVTPVQAEVTFERIHRMCIFLYNKLNDLADEVASKVDRRDLD